MSFRFGVFCCGLALQGLVAGFLSPNPNGMFDGRYEYLTVSYLPGPGGLQDRCYRSLRLRTPKHQFDLYLGQQITAGFDATEDFRMSLLPSESLDLTHRHA